MWFLVFLLMCVNAQNLVVIRMTVPFEERQELILNSTIEYILDFLPNSEQQQWPGRLALGAQGGDEAHPVLLTARQGTGAVSWQLPYTTGGVQYRTMERFLCPNRNGYSDESNCAGPEVLPTNAFSLHIITTCFSGVVLTVEATPARDWILPFEDIVTITAAASAPKVHHYNFRRDQESVRIALASEDEVCAVVYVQNFTCPILQIEESTNSGPVRMTMLQSAGVQVSRSSYPNGFFLVVVVKSRDVECTGEDNEPQDWLFQAALGSKLEAEDEAPQRVKQLTVLVYPSLTRAQYAIAASVTFLVFLLFYVSFLVLVYAQRWPWLAKHVRPLAPPSEPLTTQETIVGLQDSGYSATPTRRQRRHSTATFDSENNSITDDEDDVITPPVSFSDPNLNRSPEAASPREGSNLGPQTVFTTQVESATNARNDVSLNTEMETVNNRDAADTNGQQNPQLPPPAASTPYGLPATLRLAALSRRGARVIQTRSDRYLQTVYVVAVFYALPVVQFVAAFQIVLNVSGSLDICYYNFLCAHPAGRLSDFNHVFSNLGYLMLGALFMLQVRRRRRFRKRTPRNEEYGIPAHYGLLSSLGAAMMVVALLSASYHICPNQLNFQFDTAFMYVLSVLSMVKIYQSRHPDVNARAHATFGVLAILIALVVWGVLSGGALFWAFFTVLHLLTFMILSLRIYYVGQFRLERAALQSAARELAQVPKFGVRPLYKPRLVMLLIANAVNWAFALYGLWNASADFAGHLLQVLLGNTLLYMIFYLVMKLMHGERPRWYSWCYLAGASAAWGPALYFFVSGSSDWSATPAISRHSNHQCYVMQFYDSHDLWHLLSAVALYLSFNAMMTWDDGLAAVKRTEIAVF